jgi:TPR repeat protein
VQAKVFQSESEYCRGCESLFGTNGSSFQGEDLSKALGLSQLKSSADCGHADTQFRYGAYLLEGREYVKDLSLAVTL